MTGQHHNASMTRRYVFAAAATVLALAGCGGEATPEQTFIRELNIANPDSVGVPDNVLLTSGRMVCEDFVAHGASRVTDNLTAVYAERGTYEGDTMRFIAVAAVTYLCPQQQTATTTARS